MKRLFHWMNWKKWLAVVLAAAVMLTGGMLVWQWDHWFGGSEAEEAPFAAEYPLPDAISIEPHDENPPEVQNYNPDPADFVLDDPSGVEYVKEIAVVMFARSATDAQRQAVLNASGGEIVGRADMIGKWQLRVPAGDYAALSALCEQLEAMPGVQGAMPDLVVEVQDLALPSNDPWTGGTAWADICRLPEAWSTYNALTANQAKLGMVDSGVNAKHEELSGGIVQNLTTVATIDDNYEYTYTTSIEYHGTGVAGVMAARANNNKGGAGVAWNAKIYAVDYKAAQAANTKRSSVQVFYDGILTAVRAGANAINFSIGLLYPDQPNGTSKPNEHGRAAAAITWQMIDWGWDDFVIVQAAGNAQKDAFYNGYFCSITKENAGLTDAQYEMVANRIIVAGSLIESGSKYQQANYSAYGTPFAVYAPGSAIYTANTGNSAYQWLTGTSMSAPMITATAGWMFALNPSLDGGQVGQLLKMDAVSPRQVQDNRSGVNASYRMLDCVRALASVSAPYLESLQEDIVVDNDARYIIVPRKTTAAELSAALRALHGTITYEKASTAPEHLAGTGDQVQWISSANPALGSTYTLVVKGDLNGDGRSDALDAQCLLGRAEHTWQPSYSESIYTLALDGMNAQTLFDNGME